MEDDNTLAKEAKRLYMQEKRKVEKDKDLHKYENNKKRWLEKKENESKAKRSRLARNDQTLALVDCCCGIGGQLIALKTLMETSAKFKNTKLGVSFACDNNAKKLCLYNAMATSYNLPPATQADITDSDYFTKARIKSWGQVDVFMSSIPCTTFSNLGHRTGLVSVSTQAFVTALLRIVKEVRARVCVFECVTQLEKDEQFKSAVIHPLSKMGYSSSTITLDSSAWAPTKRKRLFIICHLDANDCIRFKIPRGPKNREARLYNCLLPAYDPHNATSDEMAPLSAYAIFKQSKMTLLDSINAIKRVRDCKGKQIPSALVYAAALGVRFEDLSKAAQAVWQLPLLRRRNHSKVVTYHFDKLIDIKHKYGVAPTLVKANSGAYMIRDSFGVRVLTGLEVAKIHGYPLSAITAYQSVATSNQITEAVGDGFVIAVVRDVLKEALS